ncbi:MAG: hypothetical protein I3I94_09110 [Acidaminococcaceae bacterium]|nr:hypothetical protein [Acidaminococcaceae bacterium]
MDENTTMRLFYKENVEDEKTVFYAASPRFKDENGKPVMWELKALDYDTLEEITKRHTKTVPNTVTGRAEKTTDMSAASMEMALTALVYPNLNDKDLQDSWCAIGAEDLLKKMLKPGEISDLEAAVTEAAGFKTNIGDQIKTVKNS